MRRQRSARMLGCGAKEEAARRQGRLRSTGRTDGPPAEPLRRLRALGLAAFRPGRGCDRDRRSARRARPVARLSPARPNLLLITIDTLRADHVGVYGAAQAKTPRLDRLAGGGVRFEHAQTAIPLTGPSHSTILTGQYPPVHGVRDNIVFALGDKQRTPRRDAEGEGVSHGRLRGCLPGGRGFRLPAGLRRLPRRLQGEPHPGRGRPTPGQRGRGRRDRLAQRAGRAGRSSPGCTSTTRMRPTIPPSPTRAPSRAVPTTARSRSPTNRWVGFSTRSRRRDTRATRWWRCWPTTASRWASTAR